MVYDESYHNNSKESWKCLNGKDEFLNVYIYINEFIDFPNLSSDSLINAK